MLDKRCLTLLNVINLQCVNSGYKIFSIEDLVLSMPSYLSMDSEQVLQCVKTLADKEYISVKYQDEREICTCPLTKGRLVFENRLEEEMQKSLYRKRYFLYSFLGGVLGSSLASLFFNIISLLF
jgi:uncharacterized protein YbaR (Trm112 family)